MSHRLKYRLELIGLGEKSGQALMLPGLRERQNARVQDDPVYHNESVKTQNGEHGQQTGLG